MLLGAHQSVAGGLHNAFTSGQEDGCEAIQIFTKNSNQWREPALADDAKSAFVNARKASSFARAPVLSHDSYLINLCASDDALRTKSREALLRETERCASIGVDFVVLHPGAHVGAGVESGVSWAAEHLIWILEQTKGASVCLLVENTAGQGTSIGSRFEEVGSIVRQVRSGIGANDHGRIGVCLDTCHAFAAGYDLSNKAGFDAAWKQVQEHLGIDNIRALHLNDAKKPVGSRVDRHERIGLGTMGMYPFWRLINEPKFATVVGVLETPPDGKDRAFRGQLEVLRGLRGAAPPK